MSAVVHHVKTLHQYHALRGLGKPMHPLISVVDYSQVKVSSEDYLKKWKFDFYLIALKRNFDREFKMNYGQNQYDYDEGVMFFMAPRQLLSIQGDSIKADQKSGWMLLVHPDFLYGTALARTIGKYAFFKYSIHEALFTSEREEKALNTIVASIKQEYQSTIDQHSQQIIVSQIDTLLAYSNRFYERQFITRKPMNHRILERFEQILEACFTDEQVLEEGIPTVSDIAKQLHLTPNYLSAVLMHLTGASTQHHIHEKIIDRAKQRLSTTDLSVSQIAYELGFEYPQSFSKLFKAKTKQSPIAFRKSITMN
ncbi:MAG: helix-turn-helix domain-containing protein [Salibacteraceae bacterium]